jgi:DNA ligase 1
MELDESDDEIVQETDNGNIFEELPLIPLDGEPKEGIKWKLPQLYKSDKKGNKRFWEVGFDGKYLRTRFGRHGNGFKTADSATEIEPKVKRDLLSQSLLEGTQKFRMQMRKDFVEDLDAAHQSTEPTLAHTYEDDKIFEEGSWGIEIKFDGIRARAKLRSDGSSDKCLFTSRNKKDFEYLGTELEEAAAKLLKALGPEAKELDGELYIHGKSFQKIASAVRRSKTKSEKVGNVRYFIYDFIPVDDTDLTYAERNQMLLDAFDSIYDSPCYLENGALYYQKLVIVRYIPVSSHEDVMYYLSEFESMNFEGAMLRRLDQKGYEHGRSNGLLKVKSFDDAEAIVVGVKEGKGKMKGKAIFELEGDECGRFFAAMATTMEEREYFFKNPESIIGKRVTYKHQKFTKDGKPRFPVALYVRDYE